MFRTRDLRPRFPPRSRPDQPSLGRSRVRRSRVWPLLAGLALVFAACRQEAPTVRITLTDGRVVVARVIDALPDALVVRTDTGQELRIPREAIASLDASSAGDTARASGPDAPGAVPGGGPGAGPPGQEPIPSPGPGSPAPSARVPDGSDAPPAAPPGAPPGAPVGAGSGSATPSPGPAATPRPIAAGTLVSIPAGTRFSVKIETPLSTSTNKVDDVVRGRLVSALGSQGLNIFPRDALVTGAVVESIRAGRVRDVASLSIVFRTLVPAAGAPLAVRAGTVTVQAGSQAGKDAKTIGGSAAAGSVVGAVVGGGKGAAVGAVAGAGAGTAVVLTTRGRDVRLPVGTVVEAVILAPLTVSITPALAAALGQDPR